MSLITMIVCTHLIGASTWEPDTCVTTYKGPNTHLLTFCREQAREAAKDNARITVCEVYDPRGNKP